MKRSHTRALRRSVWGALPFAAALLMGWASPASAVRVIDVRVGQHGEVTRVVVDLDGPARYHLERSDAGAPELVVHFDASAQPKVVRTLSKVVDGVRLEARPEGAVARIALHSRDVHATEETLSSPPRIVIDLRASTPAEIAAAKRPAAPRAAPSAAAEAAAPQRTAAPGATEAAVPPRPPQPAAPPPAAPSAPRTTAEVIEAQADAAAARLLGEQGAAKPEEGPAPSAAPSEGPAVPAPAQTAAPAESAPPPPAAPPAAQPELPREAAGPPGTLGAAPPPPPSSSPFWSEPGPFVTGAVLIVLALFVWFIFRRREPKEELHAGALPADAFLDRMSAFGDHTEAEANPEDAKERTEGLPLFAAATASERRVEVPTAREGAFGHEEGSLFGEAGVASGADKGVSAADLERPGLELGERVAGTASAPAPHTEESMARVLRDLEQRLAQIEQRLARDADSRERVERQVAAQTEELRVQRAAIARTQRVLRTLSRPEDLATEPVIKSPGPSSGSPD